ncbi:MAG: helix-turn-helix transcriptional regulator [Bacteroidales bacterium]|jgi:hypothetical protein|nr:helix-turn-helix transcriptional regulator [Bacteroidales bacterium]
MSIHIGHRIKEELERQGRSKVWLATAINRSRTVVYNIFKNAAIDTDLLILICQALHYDFFMDFSEDFRCPECQKNDTIL